MTTIKNNKNSAQSERMKKRWAEKKAQGVQVKAIHTQTVSNPKTGKSYSVTKERTNVESGNIEKEKQELILKISDLESENFNLKQVLKETKEDNKDLLNKPVNLTITSDLECCRYFEKEILFFKSREELDIQKLKKADIKLTYASWVNNYQKEIADCEACSARQLAFGKVFGISDFGNKEERINRPVSKRSFIEEMLNIQTASNS